jgi:four helix bundle protein
MDGYEVGAQIRRSSKSIRANIVEGYGRRRYKSEFVRILVFAHSSCDETKDHLKVLFEIMSLKDEETFDPLMNISSGLGRKICRFIQAVERGHRVNDL